MNPTALTPLVSVAVLLVAFCFPRHAPAQDEGGKVAPSGFEFRKILVEVSPPYIHLEVIPATYKMVAERVQVGPQSFKTISRRVVETPPTTRKVTVPAAFKRIEKLVRIGSPKVAPPWAKTPLVKGAVAVEKTPRYEWRDRRIEVQAPSKMLVVVPAKFETLTEKVLVREATDTAPAEYQTITRRKLVKAASVRETEIPGKYDIIRARVQVDPEDPVAPTAPKPKLVHSPAKEDPGTPEQRLEELTRTVRDLKTELNKGTETLTQLAAELERLKKRVDRQKNGAQETP